MNAKVTVLRPVEGVWLDPARLSALYAELGAAEAENLLSRAVGELALVMAGMVRQYSQGALDDFARNLRSLRRMADHVGMTALATIAEAVAQCLVSGDDTALAATWARLLRVGERSLAAEWDMRGLSG